MRGLLLLIGGKHGVICVPKVYQSEFVAILVMALGRVVLLNGASTLLRRAVAISAFGRSLSNYYPIDEHIFGLSEEQRLVIKLCIYI
jgi:hypothetical protein